MRRTVLFLHPSADLYGADRTLLQLVQGLDRRSYQCVVALPKTGPLVAELKRAGAKVEIGELGVGGRSDMNLRGLFSLARRIPRAISFVRELARVHRPVVIHTNTMIVLGGAMGAATCKARHLWHVHEILERPRALVAAYYGFLFRLLANDLVTNSAATRDAFPGLEDARIVLNGMDDERFDPQASGDAVRAECGLAPEDSLVLLTGRINSWKGQQLLVEAGRKLDAPNAHFAFLGDAPPGQPHFEEELDAAIANSGIADRFHRLSFREDVASVYAAADICVVPSTRPEPFGLVAIEAMAMAKPVVAADHGGVAEVVVDRSTGFLVKPNCPDALAGALGQLITDPKLAARMGAAGRERQQTCFSVDRYVNEFCDLYRGRESRAETPIVHVVLGKANPDRPNGVNRVVHHLACAQVETGRDVQVWGITADPGAPTPNRDYALRLFEPGGNRFTIHKELAQAVSSLPGEVTFHLHGGFLPEFSRLGKMIRAAGHSYVFTPHGAYREQALQKSPWVKRLAWRVYERSTVRGARAVQAFTAVEAQDTSRLAPNAPIAIVANGQDPMDPPVPTDLWVQRPAFGYLGRLTAHTKGLDAIVEAFSVFAASNPGSLTLIGEGEDHDSLLRKVREHGLESRVHFTGALFGEEKCSMLASFDLFVHPSRHEGLPGAVLEAAALGRPLLVTPGTNLDTDVAHFNAGLVAPTTTPRDLLVAMRTFARVDDATRNEWSRGARQMIQERFQWSRIEAELQHELYGFHDSDEALVDPSVDSLVANDAERVA